MLNPDLDPELVRVEGISKVYDLTDFDCDDNDLNEFLRKDSLKYKEQLIANTFIVIYKDKVVAFFSMMNDSIKLKITETESTSELNRLPEYPALKIGRLGVDKNFKGQGFGKFIIDFVVGVCRNVNEVSASRFISVDSYPDSVLFYEKMSFIRNLMYEKKRDFVSMRLDIIDLIR